MSGTSRGETGEGEHDPGELGRDGAPLGDPSERWPAAMCIGPGHVVMHGNAAFLAAYGEEALGLPAREVLLDLPAAVFVVFDAALAEGQPLGCWIKRGRADWRLTVVPRRHPETDEIFGLLFRLRLGEDQLGATADTGASTDAGGASTDE